MPRQIEPMTSAYAGFCTTLAILVIAAIEHHTGFDIIIASYGASAMIMFHSHNAPAAQPRSVLFGNILSGIVGVSARRISLQLGEVYPPISMACAAGSAVVIMSLTCCQHPPGVATALVAYIESEGTAAQAFTYVLHPIGSGVLLLIAMALVLNNLCPDRRYPTYWY